MTIVKSRRRFLYGLAAAGTAGIGSSYFLSQQSLARMALQGASGREDTPQPKIVFVVVADGFGTGYFNPYDPTDSPERRPLWHPWGDKEGDSTSGDNNDAEYWFGREIEDPILASVSSELAAFKNRSLYIRGTRVGDTSASGHQGWNEILRDNKRTLPSIDQILGAALPGAKQTLNCVYAGHISHNPEFSVSWTASAEKAAMINNPIILYDNIFGSSGGRGQVRAPGVAFDPAIGELTELKESLTGPEREKLSVHLDAAEKLAGNLNAGVTPVKCEEQNAPDFESVWLSDHTQRSKVLQGHAQVLAGALACGMMRVATFQIGASSEETDLFEDDGTLIGNAHQCAHQAVGGGGPGNLGNIGPWRKSRVWYAKRVLKLLEELNNYPDPHAEGALLDHTLVVITSELSDGLPEHQYDMPLLLVGGERSFGTMVGKQRLGRFLNIRDQSEDHAENQFYKYHVKMSRIWNTIATVMGVDSGFDSPSAAGDKGAEVVSGIFTGVTRVKW